MTCNMAKAVPASLRAATDGLRYLRNSAVRFVRDADGSMTNLAVATAVTMIAFGGLGIDMMNAELKRAKIQATLDRSVLAAADLENVLNPRDVVFDYFTKMGVRDALADVNVDQGFNYKRVTAEAATSQNANFAQIFGVDRFDIGGRATAEEEVNNVEVSLVLDISGSMADNSRLTNMQAAAQLFVDTVIDPDYPDAVSISMVPYSEHVNVGPLADHLNVTRFHGFSDCLEMPDDQMATTVLDTNRDYLQMQHFQWNFYGDNDLDNTICPADAYAEIQPMTNNANSLKAQIRAFQPKAGTSIFLGMKWGVALLDPSSRGIVNAMANAGQVPGAMRGRPMDYDRDDVSKHVLLMTDGKHDRSFRIQNWAYQNPSMVAHWADNNLWYFNVESVSDPWSWEDFYSQRYSQGYGDALLDDICDAAKARDIVIWTVAFETDSDGANVMRQCASSPAHFFEANGNELEDVFYSIARAINQLRLTE